MINIHSLAHRLYLATSGALILLTVLIFAISSYVLKDKSDLLYDNMLVAVSKNIDDKLYSKNGQLKLDMDYFSVDTLSDVRSEKIFYRVVSSDGTLLAGFEGLPLAPEKSTNRIQFYHTVYAGTPLRAVQFTTKTKAGKALIIVAESLQGREATLDGIHKQITFASVFTVLIAMLLVGAIVQSALNPLKKLQKEIRLRSESNLDPITCDVPPEVEALVSSINKLMSRLQASIYASRNFNADLSHQLRTPLAEMKMQLELYQKSAKVGVDLLEPLESNISMMSRITTQMLNYANAQNSSVTDKYWRVVDIVEYGRDFCSKHAFMVYQRGQALAFETNIEFVQCRVDEVMLESALLNLLENALKYAHCEGNENEIVVEVFKDAESVDISIRDQGPGVSIEHLQSVLQRTVRVDQARQGFGLGLAIAREVAIMHGGDLKLENLPHGLKATISGLQVPSSTGVR